MCVKQRRRSTTLQKTERLRDQERPDPVVTFSPGQVLKVSDSMLSIHTLPPVMGKSQSRFDLNRDWIAPRDSIWPLRIRFGSLQFEIWFVWYFWRFDSTFGNLGPNPMATKYLRQIHLFSITALQFWVQQLCICHNWPQVTHQKHFGVLLCHMTFQLFVAWQWSTSAFRQLSASVERLFSVAGAITVLAATDCQHLLSKRSCCACRSEHVQGASESSCVLLG